MHPIEKIVLLLALCQVLQLFYVSHHTRKHHETAQANWLPLSVMPNWLKQLPLAACAILLIILILRLWLDAAIPFLV